LRLALSFAIFTEHEQAKAMSEPSEKATPVVAKLSDAHTRAEAGEYRESLAVVREAKALEPRNIYILAFEKQVEQLAELSDMKILSDDQRTDILESLPGIIERASEISSAPPDSARAPDTRTELNKEKEERAAALEWLKNQYFQHAHEYVRKGEYQHALAEIRRVYIIDPNNTIAKDFEKQIDQLISLRKVQTAGKGQPGAEAAPAAGEARPRAESIGLRTPLGDTPETKKKGPLSATVIIAIVLTVLAVAIAFYYFHAREKMLKPPAPSQQDVGALSLAQGYEVPEQTFVISQTEGLGTVSTQVTPETTPAPAGVVASSDFAPRNAGGSEGTTGSSRRAARQAPAEQEHETTAPGTSQQAGLPEGIETLLEEAKIVRLARPQLPPNIYASGLEGQVVVQVELDKQGDPRRVQILRSTNRLLDAAVVEAINNSEFSPRKMSSGPAASQMTIPFSFRARR
jgi:TonB family protein